MQFVPIIAAADVEVLEGALLQEDEGIPYLLQPLAVMTSFVEVCL